MTKTEEAEAPTAAPYLLRTEMRYQGTTAVFHCHGGDTYYANLEDGAWWMALLPGDVGERYESVAAIEAYIENGE